MPAVARRARRARRGATLLELVVATALALVVAGAAGNTLLRQQRAYASMAALLAGREQVGGALALLPTDLRALSPASGDVTALGPDSLQLRATIGGGIACAAVGGLALDFPPRPADGTPPLASWSAAPRPGDSAAVYDPGDAVRPAGWTLHAVAGFDEGPGFCAPPSPFAGAAPAGGPAAPPRHRLRVDPATPLPAHAGAGTAVRVLRHVRYKFYRAGDGAWYLGFTDYRAPGGWAVVQPVTGPHVRAAAAGGAADAAVLRYFDRGGVAVDHDRRDQLARVTVTLASPATAGAGQPAARAADSVAVAVRGPDE